MQNLDHPIYVATHEVARVIDDFFHAGMSKGVCSGMIVQQILFSRQAGHVVYTLTFDLTVDQCVEVH